MSRTYKDKRKRIYYQDYSTDYLIEERLKIPKSRGWAKRMKKITSKTLRKKHKGKEIPSGGFYKKLHDIWLYE
jgi:hypothetical protein